MQKSPFTPGTVAREVPGRDTHIATLTRELEYLASLQELAGRIEVYVGPRGVGKTSLLRVAEGIAKENTLDTLWITAGDAPLFDVLSEALAEKSESWTKDARETLTELLRSLKVSVAGVSIGGLTQKADALTVRSGGRALRRVIEKAYEAAIASGKRGLVVFIDEIQSADAEGLRAFAYLWQHLQAEKPNMALMAITAGLSHSPDVITDAVSFAERFRYNHLRNLDAQDAAYALQEPVRRLGVEWDCDTRLKAQRLADGYPYFLQAIGDEVWHAAGDPDPGAVLTERDLYQAIEAFDRMRLNFFRARWTKATERETDMLTAMAAMGDGPFKRGDIAATMSVPTSALSMLRRSLMDKGLIDAAGYGTLEFTAPGFAEFVREEQGIE